MCLSDCRLDLSAMHRKDTAQITKDSSHVRTNPTPPRTFWIIAVLGLIWNAMGCLNYVTQTDPDMIGDLPEAYQLVIASRPAIVTGFFVVAVFGGVLGCLLMLIRRAVARPILLMSLIGVVVTLVHAIWVAVGTQGWVGVATGTSMSLVIAAFLVWYTHREHGRQWLR